MDLRFESRIRYDAGYYREYYYDVYSKYFIWVDALLVVISLLTLFDVIIFDLFFGFLCFCCAVGLLKWAGAYFAAKKAVAKQAEGAECGESVVVTEDGVDVVRFNPDSALHFDISEISRHARSRNYVFLKTKDKRRIVLDRRNFADGEFKAFRRFLKSKGIKYARFVD